MGTALADLSWPDAERLTTRTILAVPVGATEQHGPHLPLSTDTDIAVSLVGMLAAARPEVICAPPVAYGSSGEHAGFAGTLSIGQEATELLLVELVRSATESFARVLLVSTHGGNAAAVRRAVTRLHAEGRDVLAWSPNWPGDAHAGRSETSLMLALSPERVAIDRATAGATAPLPELLPLMVERGVLAVSETGVLGDPAGASAQEGRALLDAAAAELGAAIDAWTQAP
ncbi:unannotated protein [freshwater metagenome]|uniref:Unannotated protein n=1 Tax=freshwater metagenome TaxID=449393 RepID=A0A6J7DBC1_9ZZZZ|nr:mycofactocin biosynthesis peptidyl-dipeptidase MftE [Actinomycetota bacterium]